MTMPMSSQMSVLDPYQDENQYLEKTFKQPELEDS